ncbi:MAG TPA: hypothetical protein VJU86_05080 [Pyrinomonadaceae bacterium]|nr:hypothetical protein [Pyrinomonadaceae bacterium]
MKTFTLILAALCIASSLNMAQKRPQPRVRPVKKILVDYRIDGPSAFPTIPKATQKSVLSRVFRKYLADDSKCQRDFETTETDPLKGARDAGQIVPSIVDMATGSFTAAGKRETAYVISVSECNASHADNFGSKRVAIFASQELVADVDADFRSSIVRKIDLNGDGINELLMASSDMSQGTLTEMAALVDFQNGRMRVIDDLGTVSEDSCASELPGSTSRASVISILNAKRGTMPKLRLDNYQSACRKGSRWRFISTGKME